MSTSAIVKAIYFLTNAANACTIGYGTLYFQKCGLSGFQIGLISSLPGLLAMLLQPLWGSLADRTLKTGRILFFQGVAGGIVVLFYAFNQSFPVFMLLSCLGAVFLGAWGSLLDSYTFHHLGETDRGFYSHYRVWGAYGFFIIVAGIGYVLDRTGLKAMFFGFTAIAFVAAFFCLRLEDVKPGEQTEKKPGLGFRGAMELLNNRSFFLLLCCLFLQTLADSSVWGYLSLYLKDIGTPQRFIGMAWAFGIPLEVLLFLYAPKFLKRWGAPRMIQLGLVCVALRWSLLYFFPIPWAAMLIQLIQGVAFAAVFVGAATLVDMMVPVTLKATGQTVFGTVCTLAGVLGGTLGGLLFDAIGSRNLCMVGGVLGFASLGLFTFFAGSRDTSFNREKALAPVLAEDLGPEGKG